MYKVICFVVGLLLVSFAAAKEEKDIIFYTDIKICAEVYKYSGRLSTMYAADPERKSTLNIIENAFLMHLKGNGVGEGNNAVTNQQIAILFIKNYHGVLEVTTERGYQENDPSRSAMRVANYMMDLCIETKQFTPDPLVTTKSKTKA